jgi:hypothetical protein
MREEKTLAFVMGTHANLAAADGRTAYSDDMPDELLIMLCQHMRFKHKDGASKALHHLLGLTPQ